MAHSISQSGVYDQQATLARAKKHFMKHSRKDMVQRDNVCVHVQMYDKARQPPLQCYGHDPQTPTMVTP